MKIMLSAGEVSGDVHGAYLVRELKTLSPDISFFGMGGEKLLAEGVNIKYDITARGSIGLSEALPNAFPIYLIYRKMVALLKNERPDVLILIDSQGINVPLAKEAKKLKIKTVYYIAPQEWLWGTPAGVKKIASAIDLIIAIFEKEYESYKNAGAKVVYFGHPLIDIVKSSVKKAPHSPPCIAICPGSRRQEIKGLFPILLKSAKLIQREIPGLKFIIPAATEEIYNELNTIIRNSLFDIRNLEVRKGRTYDILASSDLAICTSGTINMEASILGIPNIMVYKISPITYWIGKYILRILDKLPYFSMPNILLNKIVVPELVMKNADPQKIADEALSIINNSSRREGMVKDFSILRNVLGSPGVIQRIANEILRFSLA